MVYSVPPIIADLFRIWSGCRAGRPGGGGGIVEKELPADASLLLAATARRRSGADCSKSRFDIASPRFVSPLLVQVRALSIGVKVGGADG